MPAKISMVKDDFDGDQKTVSWDVKDVTEQTSYANFIAANADLVTEVNKWSAGRDHRTDWIIVADDNGPGKASSPVAQGNMRIILEAEDTVTGSIYRFPIPMPALSKSASGSDPAWIAVGQGSNSLTIMNPDHADYATLKTEFEATVQSPNGNNVILVRGYIEE